ncbi:MAG TPA: hypothetical protein PKY31_13465 [Spirochaetota bacterium]|nr:hypothetical protein [Spirochaetota bacterium]
MGDTHIKITGEELIRMKMAVMDTDRDDALELLRLLLKRAEAAGNAGLKNHLDR